MIRPMDHSVVLDLIRQFGSSVVAIAHQLHAGATPLDYDNCICPGGLSQAKNPPTWRKWSNMNLWVIIHSIGEKYKNARFVSFLA